MLRFSYILWATCLGSVAATLSGCTPGMQGSVTPQTQVETNQYDSYYGLPPNPGRISSQADRTSTVGMQVNPAAPQTYTVKKGDTLWGIARKFLNTPWYWPELWDKNQRIANPHRIYPGDVLHFGYVKADNTDDASLGEANKLVPRIRVEHKGNDGEALSTLAPFLKWPRVLTEDEIRSAPYILESRDGHRLITSGETIYTKNLRNPRMGERYAIYHPDKPLKDPETGVLLGHQVTYSGYARIDRVDQISTATVLEAEGIIRPGDRLLPVDSKLGDLRAPIQIPTQKIRGQIAGLYDAEYIGANCMVIIINRGKRHGIKLGYTVGVYSDGRTVNDEFRSYAGAASPSLKPKVKLPPEKVANAIIYKVDDNLSYGLIIDAEREVHNGDKIGNP